MTEAPRYEDTDWERILALYTYLDRLSANPVVRLNLAVAAAMVDGPDRGLAILDELAASGALARSHRLHAVRAHLLEQKGDARRSQGGVRRGGRQPVPTGANGTI